MKKNLFIIAGILFFSVTAFAQEETTNTIRPPKWVSEKGYWVVESNIHHPDHSLIFFYNNDGVLIYKEKADGIRLNINKRKTKMQLKKGLEEAVVAYEKNKKISENEMMVMNRKKRK